MNIDKIIQSFGASVYIKNDDDWSSPLFNAFIQPLRYKNKLYMTGDFTPIGKNTHDVYLYIGLKITTLQISMLHIGFLMQITTLI